MVDSNALGRDIDSAIATGRDNAAVRADVEGWCTHLKVELLGVSMVGQMAGVPIGSHRLSCKHAQGAIESIALRDLFQHFLIDNCTGCTFHVRGSKPHLGESLLAAAQSSFESAQNAENERNARIANMRAALTSKANQLAASEQVEAASVFRLAADLFEDSNVHVAQILCETCNIAPDLFDDQVVGLLELGTTDLHFAERCLTVLSRLARTDPMKRERVRRHIIEAAILTLPIECISDSLDACLNDLSKEPSTTVIDRLIAAQNYQRPFGGWPDSEEPEYPKTIQFLSRLIDADPERVSAVIATRLNATNKWHRANTCRVVEELGSLRPEFGLSILPNLIRSLELEDDHYLGISADASALDAITEMLVLRWDKTHKFLSSHAQRLSTAAQTCLLGAYEKLFRRGQNWREETTEGLDQEIANGAIRYCLELLNDVRQEPSIRRAAAEVIHSACRAGARAALDSFDQLFGCLAILVDAAEPPLPTPTIILPGQEVLQEQDAMLRRQDRQFEWDRLKQELSGLVEEIGERRPTQVGDTLLAIIEPATTTDRRPLKTSALRLLGEVAHHDPDLARKALPTFMSCLMDYSSPAVRATAIRAVREAFSRHDLTLPSNVVDVITIHLRDSYVVVHQEAASFFVFAHPALTDSQRNDAFIALLDLWVVYAQNANQMFFMDDLADAMLAVARRNMKMRNIAMSLVSKYLPTVQVLVDSKLCETLVRSLMPDSPVAVRAAQALIGCLARHHRDLYNGRGDWREAAAHWLSAMPTHLWQDVASEFIDCARSVVQKDPGESMLFAAVLSEHGAHAEEAEVLMIAANAAEGHGLFHGMSGLLRELRQQVVRLLEVA